MERNRIQSTTTEFFERLLFAGFLVSALVAVVAACMFGEPSPAYADSIAIPIGVVQSDGKNLYATSFKQINEELVKLKGKTVSIDMYRDWNARDTSAEGVAVSEHLVIPPGTRVTLNMNGYLIDRGLSGEARDMSKSGGEVIKVQAGAVLTVNGGSSVEAKARTHDAYVYASTEAEGFAAPMRKTFTGALIAGGNSKDGAGGIRMLKGSTVTLNDVVVAGCRDQAPAGTYGSGGGGVRMESGNTTLNMSNSSITGCFANNGGGIYIDASGKEAVNLENSHIDGNYAREDGGGINLGVFSQPGKEVSIIGNGNSGVSSNHCEYGGGGINVYSSKVSIRGLSLEQNSANRGGGIYACNDSIALHKLVVKNNTAKTYGGGLGITSGFAYATHGYEGDSSVSDCTVQGNSAPKGGGILFNDYYRQRPERKRAISGTMVVKDNTSTDGGIGNLLIETDAWSYKRESFSLAEGSEVWAGWQKVADESISQDVKGSVVADKKCEAYLHSEQAGLAFRFDLEKRYIDLVSSSASQAKPTAVGVTAANANNAAGNDGGGARTAKAGKLGKVAAGGESGNDYDLVRGFFMHDNETDLAAFYYSDALFYADPKTYNTHLATLSWTWAYTAGYLNQFKDPSTHQNTSSADAGAYYNKHAAARQFLADIGCPDQNIYVNDSMVSKPSTDSIGVAIGSKNLKRYEGGQLKETGDVLVPVAVRGMGYETEWASNVTIGTAEQMSPTTEAWGFSNAADQVVSEIAYYLKKNGLEDELETGHVKFWVTGFSRAGATANLTSKRLVDKIEAECDPASKSQVFAYPCEPPKGGSDSADEGLKNSDDRYFCIHNMVNAVDIVPFVAPEQMGFKRYGVDHYIPGSEAGMPVKTTKAVNGAGAGGPATVTTFADNAPWKTKTSEYNAQKAAMLKQLSAVDSDFVFDDYFHPKALDFISVSQLQLMRIYDNGDADNRVEDFVEDFMRFIQQGPPDKDWGAAASSRDAYANSAYALSGKTHPTIQAALGNLVKTFMGASGDAMSGFLDKAGNIKENIPSFAVQFHWFYGNDDDPAFSMSSLYFNVIGKWHALSDKQKTFWTTNLWNAFKKSGALDELSPSDQAAFEASFPTVVNLAFTFVDGDYNYKPKDNGKHGFPQWATGSSESMMYAPTFMEHAPYIISCHMPQLNIAWARSYDSWFSSELDGYALVKPASVAAPTARRVASGAQQALTPGEQANNRFAGSQRILLENDDIVGEAVYYDLVDTTSGKTLARNQIYRGGIDLSLEGASGKKFQLKAYDMSYGVPSGTVTYNVELYTANHTVIVKDLAVGSQARAHGFQAAPEGPAGGGHGLMAGSIADPALLQAQEADAYRTTKLEFAEGESAVVQADSPDDRFFKAWKVVSKTADGSDAYHGADLADEVFDPAEAKFDAAASFTMPVSSADSVKFPSGYQLELTAQYGTRITDFATMVSAPVAGASLAGDLEVTFPGKAKKNYPIAWAYKHGDTMVPAHAESDDAQPRAYGNTEYAATIVIPQDARNDIAFASSVDVSSSVVTQGNTTTETRTVQRNDDGSITIQMAFPATGGGGEQAPEASLQFAVHAIDLGTGQSLAPAVQYSALPSRLVTITAPDVDGKRFAGWDLGNKGIRPKYSDPSVLNEKTIALRMPAQLGEGAAITANYVAIASADATPKASHALAAVRQLANIEGVSYGTSEDGIRALLPQTTKVLSEDGFESDATIEWGAIAEVGGADAYGSKTWLASGSVKLPADFHNPGNVSLGVSLAVAVDGADTALSPSASLESGTFLYDQVTVLATNEAGGTTYFTTDGSDPTDVSNPNRLRYHEGTEIYIPRWYASPEGADAQKTFTLKAYTVVDGKMPSPVAAYGYEFEPLHVPQATDYEFDSTEHIGVPAGAYYTLVAEPESNARIDEYGNAVATLPGTYRITAVLDSVDDSWALEPRTGENQVVEFTIAGETPSEDVICNITVEASPSEGGSVSGGGAYVQGQAVTVRAQPNEGYEFVNWTLRGQIASSEARYEFSAADDSVLVANFKKVTPAPDGKVVEDNPSVKAGASADSADKFLVSYQKETDPAGSSFNPLRLRASKVTKASVKLTWKAVPGARKYVVYGAACGKNNLVKVATLGKSRKAFTWKKISGKKLVKNKYYKAIVVAINAGGKVISTSKMVHAATAGGIKGNYAKVTTKAKDGKVALRVGKTLKLGAKASKPAGKKVNDHRKHAIMYVSSNSKIASVNKKGLVKARKTGTCTVYAYTQNGACTQVKVKVTKRLG